MKHKKSLSIAAGILISVVLLAGSFHQVDAAALFVSLRNVNIPLLLCFTLSFALSCLLRAFMWDITTSTIRRSSVATLFGGVVVGYMVNGILPFRAGELFRAQYLASTTGFRRTAAFSTIVIERFFDVLSLGLLLIVSLFLGIHGISMHMARIVLVIWLIIVVAAGLIVAKFESLEQGKKRLGFLPHRLADMITHFLAPLGHVRAMKKFVLLLLLSGLVWCSNYLGTLALVYGSSATMKLEAAVLLFLFLNIGMLIPAAPGSLGVVQLAFWMSLSRFGVAKEQALALSFAYLAATYVFTLGVGLPFFLKAHLKLGEVSEQV